MRTKTLFSLIVLCGSTAALANLPAQQDTPLANNMTNEGVPAPDTATPDTTTPDTTAPETMSNTTDVEPSTGTDTTTDPTTDGTDTPPNATY